VITSSVPPASFVVAKMLLVSKGGISGPWDVSPGAAIMGEQAGSSSFNADGECSMRRSLRRLHKKVPPAAFSMTVGCKRGQKIFFKKNIITIIKIGAFLIKTRNF
jgi:hypothetical protein